MTKFVGFYGLLLLQIWIAVYTVIFPVWDKNESGFVTSLLKGMREESVAPEEKVWIGPGVGTDATVMVSGQLSATVPPADPGTGLVYKECALVRIAYEYKDTPDAFNRIIGGKGNIHRTQEKIIPGKEIKIGNWPVDTRFLLSELLPLQTSRALVDQEFCPSGYVDCSRVVSCVALGEYTVLGNRNKREDGAYFVQLPHPTLQDYPLLLKGPYTPGTFGAAYGNALGGRAFTFGWVLSLLVLGVFEIMIHVSRWRELAVHYKNKLTNEYSLLYSALTFQFRTCRDSADELTTFCCLVTPFIPLGAYQFLNKSDVFGALVFFYAVCWGSAIYGLNKRFMDEVKIDRPEEQR